MDEVEGRPSADFFKAMASLILFTIAMVGGMLPRRLQNVGSRVVSCLNMAAGGVFFASAMVSSEDAPQPAGSSKGVCVCARVAEGRVRSLVAARLWPECATDSFTPKSEQRGAAYI